MTRLTATEKQLEDTLMELFDYYGHTVKTEAGSAHSGALLPPGFPDFIAMLPIPGSPWALVCLAETKTPTGKLSAKQVAYHALLRSRGLSPQVVRDVRAVQTLVAQGKALLGRIARRDLP